VIQLSGEIEMQTLIKKTGALGLTRTKHFCTQFCQKTILQQKYIFGPWISISQGKLFEKIKVCFIRAYLCWSLKHVAQNYFFYHKIAILCDTMSFYRNIFLLQYLFIAISFYRNIFLSQYIFYRNIFFIAISFYCNIFLLQYLFIAISFYCNIFLSKYLFIKIYFYQNIFYIKISFYNNIV